MKRVLVTGATGFLGRHTLPFLKERGYEVHLLSRANPDGLGHHFHSCDLFDDARLKAIIESVKPSHLLHLAWYVEHGKFWDATENLDWVAASIKLVKLFAESGGERVAVSGTCAEYDWSHSLLAEKSTPLKPASPYGMAKNSLRELLTTFAPSLAISLAWCRLFFLYGPYENERKSVAFFITKLLQNQKVCCFSGSKLRDFMHIEDAANAIVTTLDSDYEGPINIATGQTHPIGAIAKKIGNLLGREDLFSILQDNSSGDSSPECLQADVAILREELGFQPRYDIASGLENAIAWWKDNLLTHKL